jgi:hypothetical protein
VSDRDDESPLPPVLGANAGAAGFAVAPSWNDV